MNLGKSRRCSNCRKKVPTESIFVTGIRAFCSMDCLSAWGKTEAARLVLKKASEKAKRKKDREDKEKIKSRSEWLSEAQNEFNKYVRLRDKDHPCISCGSWEDENVRGGMFDCGHYRSRGAAPQLRFHLWNAHKQCVKCNRYLSGNVVEFRRGLEVRIGKEKLDYIESFDEITPLTIERLRRVKSIFKRKIKLKNKCLRMI